MPEHGSDIWPPFEPTLSLGPDLSEAPPLDNGAAPRGQPGVLLVDDDPFMLGMQSRMLRSMGYTKIGTAMSADAALTLLGPGLAAVDVIVCDLNMPDIDGLEFLRRLGDSNFRGNVILLSGEGPRIIHAVRKLLAGRSLLILGALEKPAGRAALRALLDRWQQTLPPPAAVATEFIYTAADLRAAQQAEQWVLHYQPKVDLRTGALGPPGAWAGVPRPLHRPCRGLRCNRRLDRMGAARRADPAGEVAPGRPGDPHGRQPVDGKPACT